MKWKPKDAEYQRDLRRICRAEGICCCCKKRVAVHSFCGVCMEHRAEVQARRKARWIEAGKCFRCGHERDREDRRMCAKCRAYMNPAKARKVAA